MQRWGEPRFTADVDLTLFTGFGDEAQFAKEILGVFPARIRDAAEFANRSRVLLVEAPNGIPVDISLGALPFEEGAVSRSTPWQINEETSITTCSAEDLIVHKCFANRIQDWLDVEGIVGKQRGALDWTLILRELRPLVELKNAPEILSRLEERRNR